MLNGRQQLWYPPPPDVRDFDHDYDEYAPPASVYSVEFEGGSAEKRAVMSMAGTQSDSIDNDLRVSFNSADFKEAGLHKEGSKVRLGGLKNPDLNGKTGTIIGYTKGGDRVIISVDGPHGLVKVKPKKIEILEGLPADAHDRTSAHPGLSRAKSQQSQQLAQSYQTDASAASLSSM